MRIDKEIRKRPFVRLIIVWIIGILWQSGNYTPPPSDDVLISAAAILIASTWIINSFLAHRAEAYRLRWLWGAIFLSTLLMLSLRVTHEAIEHKETRRQGFQTEWITKLREQQKESARKIGSLPISPEEKTILQMVAVGYRSGYVHSVREQFNHVGAAHLLAVSGFHVGIVIAGCTLLLYPLQRLRWIRAAILLTSTWFYVGFSGFAPSSVRAGIMGTAFIFARNSERRIEPYNTLAMTALAMLIFKPLLLFNAGFLLSFAAVFFIFYASPVFEKLIEVRNPIFRIPWQWFCISLSAQIGTAGLVLYFFHDISWLFIFTSIPLSFLSLLMIPTALAWVVLPKTWSGPIGLEWALCKISSITINFLEQFQHIDTALIHLPFNKVDLIGYYAFWLVLFFYCKQKKPFNGSF